MARDHARIQIDIWNDEDFRQLTASAQLLYFQLLSSATLTYAGVADWRSKRLAMLSLGRTGDEVEMAMAELEEGLFVVCDDESEEVFIRSFFKWDGLLQKPNVAKAMIKAWDKVHSLDLKAVIVHELKRLRDQFPDWKAFEHGVVDELLSKRSLDPLDLKCERVTGRVPERDAPLPTPNSLLPSPCSPAPSDTSAAATADIRPDVEALLDLLDSEMRNNEVKKLPKRNETNVSAMRRLIDIDGYSPDAVARIIRWCQADSFWKGNIMSAAKLREKFEQLRLHANRQREERQGRSRADEATDFIQRLEAIDATHGSREVAGDHQQLR